MISQESKKRLEERKRKERKKKEVKDKIKDEVFFALAHNICPYCSGDVRKLFRFFLTDKRWRICNKCGIKFEARVLMGDMDDRDYYSDCEIIKMFEDKK